MPASSPHSLTRFSRNPSPAGCPPATSWSSLPGSTPRSALRRATHMRGFIAAMHQPVQMHAISAHAEQRHGRPLQSASGAWNRNSQQPADVPRATGRRFPPPCRWRATRRRPPRCAPRRNPDAPPVRPLSLGPRNTSGKPAKTSTNGALTNPTRTPAIRNGPIGRRIEPIAGDNTVEEAHRIRPTAPCRFSAISTPRDPDDVPQPLAQQVLGRLVEIGHLDVDLQLVDHRPRPRGCATRSGSTRGAKRCRARAA